VVLIIRTWSLTLREEHRSIVFENRTLERIFEPQRESSRPMKKTVLGEEAS
jgi:hypothetical protein